MKNVIKKFLQVCLSVALNNRYKYDDYNIFKATYNINRAASNADITLDKASQLSILESAEQFLIKNSLEVMDAITDYHLNNLLVELEEKHLIRKD